MEDELNIKDVYEKLFVLDNRTQGMVESIAKLYVRVQKLEDDVKGLKGE